MECRRGTRSQRRVRSLTQECLIRDGQQSGAGHSVSFKSMNNDIQTLPLEHGYQADFSDDPFPSTVAAWSAGSLALASDSTHYGFIHQGNAQLTCVSGAFTISAGMYFAVPGDCTIEGTGSGIVMSRKLSNRRKRSIALHRRLYRFSADPASRQGGCLSQSAAGSGTHEPDTAYPSLAADGPDRQRSRSMSDSAHHVATVSGHRVCDSCRHTPQLSYERFRVDDHCLSSR